MAAFATSYIKTEASQVTRSADSASMTGTNFSSWYRDDEGTLYAEGLKSSGDTLTRRLVSINDTTTNNSIQNAVSTAQQGYFEVRNNNVLQASISNGSITAGNFFKIAVSYATDNFGISTNSVAATTDTSGNVPVVSQMQIGTHAAVVLNGHIRKLSYYPIRCTNLQLQSLTQQG